VFQPKKGTFEPEVGDRDDVSPTCWDCWECTASIDVAGKVGTTVECPRCGSKYEFKSEAKTYRTITVEMTEKHAEPSLRLVLDGYGSYPGKLLL